MARRESSERIVIVGAGLAALRGAEAIREAGFSGPLAIVGAESHRPYDRPPLSKHVLSGEIAPDATTLPSRLDGGVDWHLGQAAVRLDRAERAVRLADGRSIPYDRLLIATGARARPWPDPREGQLAGVHILRGRDDAARLRAALAAGPRRVMVIGGGFIGCEVAALCRQLELPVTLVEPGPTLLARILGQTVGALIGAIHESRGVEIRCGAKVERLEDADGRFVAAHLDDGTRIDADVVVVALGAVRETGWLAGSGLSADEGGLDCDGDGHALDTDGRPDPRIAAAGDVARFPHPLYGGRRVALEHWSHAAAQGIHAGRLLAGAPTEGPYAALPTFWSSQGGVTVKSVGLTDGADALAFVQGDPTAGRFLALYGRADRCIAAVSVDSARWLPAYAEMVASGAPFPPRGNAADRPGKTLDILAPGFPEAHRTDKPMPDATLLDQVKDFANRADPYPLYARLRESPVSRQEDGTESGTWVAASHGAIASLLHDPRVSSDTLPPADRPRTGNPLTDLIVKPIKDAIMDRHRAFIFRDPPDHDALRAAVMNQFTRERVQAMRARSDRLVADLLDAKCGASQFDVVDDLAYPLPVTVICELFGVPREDEPKFHDWATQLATALEPDSLSEPETRAKNSRTFDTIGAYMADLIKEKRRHPQDDMLSGLANEATPAGTRMGDYDLIATAILMLVAGHETTVNLITNGLLTLLRNPHELERLRADPLRAPRLIEELLRYEPPVQFRTRKTLAAIDIAGVTIPEGADLVLLLASGNRDGTVFPDPDRFDPDRTGTRHLGFGGSLHYCVGAPLARFEAEAALTALARRLKNPRLIEDPPPYRPGAALRGPEHLRVAIEGIA